MDEFALIRRHFAGLTPARADVPLSIGDDCALLAPPAGHELAITTDTLIAGRHFPESTEPFDIGWKALAVNLSDLAAMGAQPLAFLLALTLPAELAGAAARGWLGGFTSGLQRLAAYSGVALIGGDTTRGPLSITITALGSLPAGTALKRSGAMAGDLVCVTGTLGDAALALQRLAIAPIDEEEKALRRRLDRPLPRLAAGLALRDLATAAIDLSDGLAGDLQHVLDASGVGAEIDADALPMSPEFASLHAPASRLALQASGGDDYELCVCLPPSQRAAAQSRLDVPLTVIGRIVACSGLYWQDSAGNPIEGPKHGYRHF